MKKNGYILSDYFLSVLLSPDFNFFSAASNSQIASRIAFLSSNPIKKQYVFKNMLMFEHSLVTVVIVLLPFS